MSAHGAYSTPIDTESQQPQQYGSCAQEQKGNTERCKRQVPGGTQRALGPKGSKGPRQDKLAGVDTQKHTTGAKDMSATPDRYADNLSRTDDTALLQSRMAACQWFLSGSKSRLARLVDGEACEASLQAERLSIARNTAAIEAIGAKLKGYLL